VIATAAAARKPKPTIKTQNQIRLDPIDKSILHRGLGASGRRSKLSS